MSAEQEKVDGYLATIARLEPELHMVDRDASLASIAISLKRIADALDIRCYLHDALKHGASDEDIVERVRESLK